MKRHLAALLATTIAGLAQASADIGSGTLTLAPSMSTENRLTVTISASASGLTASDADTTDVSGTLNVALNTDASGGTTQFTINHGDLAMTDMDFNLRALFISVATFNTSGMGGTAFTITPPGLATPTAAGGSFDASLHRFSINEGAITGQLTIPGDPVTPINEDFNPPVQGEGLGTGNLTVTPGAITETQRVFAVAMTLPLDFTSNQTISGTPVTIRVQGNVKATGTIAVPIIGEIARWTFDTGTTSNQRLAASNFQQVAVVSGLAFNTSFTDFGPGVAPSGVHDGFGFRSTGGDNVITLKRANYFNNSAVPDPRPTTEDYTSWGAAAGVGTGANLSAIGNAPISFAVTAGPLAPVTVDSLTVDFTSGSDIIFQFQEAGAPAGTGVTLRSATPLATVPLAVPVEIGAGLTKAFTININSGSLNSSHNIDSIALNGMFVSPPVPIDTQPMGTGAATTADLKITFHESVQAGSGSIRLFRANGTPVQAISINAPGVTISGRDVTIPIEDPDPGTSYYVTIDSGSVIDPSGSAFGGINDTTTWAFTTIPGTTVTNFSNFSESGNLLTSPNIRQQTFTPGGTSVTVTSATSHAAGVVGQETYLTDEFPPLTTGYRISVDLTAATFNTNQSAQTIALAVASAEALTSRTNLLIWGWRSGSMYIGNFGGTSGTDFVSQVPAYPSSGRPDSVFIERTATGWTLGSIKNGIETINFTNITAVGASAITAAGTAFGLFSDMRIDSATWTVNNLVITPPANTFSNWMANPVFGIAPADRDLLDDPDGDGLLNGVEAWFGTHPGQFSAGLSGPSTNGTITTFTRPANVDPPSDLGISYQWSPDLSNWYPGNGLNGPPGGPTVNIQVLTSAGSSTVTATASAPLGRVFLRAALHEN